MPSSLLEMVTQIRRDLHQHPEIGFDLDRTVGVVTRALSSTGLSVRTGVGRSGVVADLTTEGAQQTLALRADMDALPMDEENTFSYRSQVPGRAHMCGHDAHTAMLIGAAHALWKQRHELSCNVRFIFQPSEEAYPGGAPGMIAEGALDGVDEIYALHVWPWLETGSIGICDGPALAQADTFQIHLQGRGGHGAAPHQTIDPIAMGAQVVTALQSVVSRNVSPLEEAVLSVTQFHGGSADNVIPSICTLEGTARSYSPPVQEILETRLREITEGISKSYGGRGTVTYQRGYPPLINHPQATQRACHAASLSGELVYPGEKALFGEDFAYYLHQVPGCFLQLGCRSPSAEASFPLHHPQFNLDENCLAVGIRTFLQICLSQGKSKKRESSLP